MKTTTLTLALFAAIASFAESAKAAVVPGAIPVVNAIAGVPGDNATGNGSISRVFDGSGLTIGNPNDDSTWLHDNNWETGWQGQLNGKTKTWVVADLGANLSTLRSLYLWNVNEGSATARGVRQMDIYYSSSPSVTPVTEQLYDFSSGGWTQLNSTFTVPEGTNLPAGNVSSSKIDLTAISSARYIGFDLLSNYANDTYRTGLAEVQFSTIPLSSVPEPSTSLGLLALSAGGLLTRRNRNRKA
ncbi:MAG: PEP-CTERM motif-containing protein [Verrucomicrobia bacterium]|nr:MAG: PEP-CTERM motif-containing protein [Verrucomicrobiota bacterium]